MSDLFIGTIQHMKVNEKSKEYYRLSNHTGEALLPIADLTNELKIDSTIDVFIYKNKENKLMASHHLPEAQMDVFGWGEIVEVLPNLGAFIQLGTAIDILVSMDDLPTVEAAWPAVGDQLYVRLKQDKKGRLLASPASEHAFNDVYAFAEHIELNDAVQGHVIRPGREGAVIITENKYRGFIHHTERENELRLGQLVSGRVIEVKEDGSLNVSLLPLKHERIDDDAAKILQYIQDHDGKMPYGNKTDPDTVRDIFQMSKSAFKRALGRLMKEGKIEQSDGTTSLL